MSRMNRSSYSAPLHMGETTSATSSPRGTVLPRWGVFWGVRAPEYHTAVVLGELASSSANKTQIRYWLEPHVHVTEQTSLPYSRTGLLRLANFDISLDEISARAYGDLASSQFITGSYSQTTADRVIRNVDVAHAFIPRWDDLTESPWRRFRDAVAPLRDAAVAILEAIAAELQQDVVDSNQSRHAGLAAVAGLTKILGLSRPTILRMGGVPESTFYAWQKNPQSIVRTPSVSRLLRLQAQVGLLAEALGLDGLNAWLHSRDRLEKLQGDDAIFAQTLAEAEEALTEATRVVPRPRMRLGDYEFHTEASIDNQAVEFPQWPGASKLPDELAE